MQIQLKSKQKSLKNNWKMWDAEKKLEHKTKPIKKAWENMSKKQTSKISTLILQISIFSEIPSLLQASLMCA